MTTKERPMIFSAPMVRSLLSGSKTQTRRIAKLTDAGHVKQVGGHRRWHPADPNAALACPYGRAAGDYPGDRLWVRETHFINHYLGSKTPGEDRAATEILYRATDMDYVRNLEDDEGLVWKPSIHMPRWASRITLEITRVRIERLQGISEADAKAEGIERSQEYPALWKRGPLHGDQNTVNITGFPVLAYRSIWEEINGHESWAANPLVWVVEFKVIKP